MDLGVFCWELREYLLWDKVCSVDEILFFSFISCLVKSKIINEVVEKKEFVIKWVNKCESINN